MDFLEGTVERITYHNAENGYSVIRLKPPRTVDLVTLVGNLPELSPGEYLRLQGQWVSNADYGRQFKVERCEQALPATIEGIRRYLGSGLIKGVGPKTADRIVETFGKDTLDVIDSEPHRLREVPDIGPKRYHLIREAWEAQKHIKEVMVFLQGHGITTGLAVKIYKQYGDESLNVVRTDPYQLARDIWGIGFRTADKIARALGLPPDAPSRLEAGLAHALSEAADDGHVYLPQPELLRQAAELLELPADTLPPALDQLAAARLIQREVLTPDAEPAVYLMPFYQAEVKVTERLLALLNAPVSRLPEMLTLDWAKTFDGLQLGGAAVTLSAEQRLGVQTALTNKVCVLTGGPGTGKCVVGDSLLALRQGLIPIASLAPQDGMQPDTDLPINVAVTSRQGIVDASHFYYGGRRETIRLMTAEGYTLEATPNHRIITAGPQGPQWKRMDELEADAYVAIYRSVPSYQFEFHPLAYFLGIYVGDGNVDRRPQRPITGLNITSADEEVWEFVESKLPELKLTVNMYGHSGRARMYYIGRLRRNGGGGAAAVLREWGCKLVGARQKEVPTKILQGDLSQQRSFLMGLFDADGSVDLRDGSVELCVTSGALIRAVQVMLLQFGITSVLIQRPAVDAWRLHLQGDSARQFYATVGFRILRKQRGADYLPSRSNTNRDVVPGLGTGLLRSYIGQTGKHDRRWWWKWKREARGERMPHRGRLISLLDASPVISPESQAIRALCADNLYWARVSQLSASEADVYDLHVPVGNEFVANGFVNHNTTTLRTLMHLLERKQHPVALASPTGRAAKRLAEATGRPAQTIHRLLGFSPQGGFEHNEQQRLPAHMVVIDEVSMLDLVLTNNLLKAIDPAAHLLFVGDVDQLPSVGAGNVLNDLVQSGRVPVIRLQTIFRQAAGSHIITNAHRINHGETPVFEADSSDFFLFAEEDPEVAAERLVEVVQTRIPRKFGLDPLTDIQVLAPMHRGAVGVAKLNERLQAALNPPAPAKAERQVGGRLYRAGDRVMQIRNNYQKEAFNGDIGRVADIDLTNQTLTALFDGRPVLYEWSECDELVHAFAVSIHKSQGSEFRAVVVPLLTQHYMMLQRNLLYTAVTRAKQLCVLVGTRKAINIAVRNAKVAQRFTGLATRLAAAPQAPAGGRTR